MADMKKVYDDLIIINLYYFQLQVRLIIRISFALMVEFYQPKQNMSTSFVWLFLKVLGTFYIQPLGVDPPAAVYTNAVIAGNNWTP
jgi:hypothetical protein